MIDNEIDKNEMTYLEFINLQAFLSAWDLCSELGIYFNPYPERDVDKNEEEWRLN